MLTFLGLLTEGQERIWLGLCEASGIFNERGITVYTDVIFIFIFKFWYFLFFILKNLNT